MLEEGIGDTIRVSLTEDPELEIPVCRDLVNKYMSGVSEVGSQERVPSIEKISFDPFNYQRRETFEVSNIGGKHVPVVIADFSKIEKITTADLKNIGYIYDEVSDKWHITDMAADYIFCNQILSFALPGTLRIISYYDTWMLAPDKEKYVPIYDGDQFSDDAIQKSSSLNFVMIDCYSEGCQQPALQTLFHKLKKDRTAVVCLSSTNRNAMQSIRRMFIELMNNEVKNPVVLITDSSHPSQEESLIHYATEIGALLLDGFSDGLCFGYHYGKASVPVDNKWINSIAFGILQAARTRISKTDYISCPSCGRTLFDLQETTAKIRSVTNHLKGLKIAIMGCIVNGPGEMADADFGYVGSGPGKITLYKGKEIVKRNVNSDVAVDELVNLLKEHNAWVEP